MAHPTAPPVTRHGARTRSVATVNAYDALVPNALTDLNEPDSETPDALTHRQRRARRPLGAAPLTRARQGRWLGGVAAGIARFVRGDVRVVRALWLLSVVPSLGITVLGYLAVWLLLPGERPESAASSG